MGEKLKAKKKKKRQKTGRVLKDQLQGVKTLFCFVFPNKNHLFDLSKADEQSG